MRLRKLLAVILASVMMLSALASCNKEPGTTDDAVTDTEPVT